MRLLLVEDSRRLRETLSAGIRRLGYALDDVADGESGLQMAQRHKYDVLILDLMLPRMDGLTVLRRLREQRNDIHVLILTAKDGVPDRVAGLQAGADDYLPKPFSFDELIARIQALARRKYGTKSSRMTLGKLVFDLAARRVTRDGEEVVLTGREFALLEYFLLRKDQVITRHQIEEAIYDSREDAPASNAVDSAVCLLRRKIDTPGQPSLIETRRGLGYVLPEPRDQ